MLLEQHDPSLLGSSDKNVHNVNSRHESNSHGVVSLDSIVTTLTTSAEYLELQREMQEEVLETVERGTYAHKVLRYKYQDVADMRMAREMLQRCEAFLAGEEAPVPV